MRHLGFKPIKTRTANKYYVVEITAEQRNAQAHDEGDAEFNRLQAEKVEAEKALLQKMEPDCFASNRGI